MGAIVVKFLSVLSTVVYDPCAGKFDHRMIYLDKEMLMWCCVVIPIEKIIVGPQDNIVFIQATFDKHRKENLNASNFLISSFVVKRTLNKGPSFYHQVWVWLASTSCSKVVIWLKLWWGNIFYGNTTYFPTLWRAKVIQHRDLHGVTYFTAHFPGHFLAREMRDVGAFFPNICLPLQQHLKASWTEIFDMTHLLISDNLIECK